MSSGKVVLVMTGVIASLVVGIFVWTSSSRQRDLRAAVAEYHAARLPSPADEIFPSGHKFTGGTDLVKSLKTMHGGIGQEFGEVLRKADYAEIEQITSKFDAALNKIASAAKKPEADFQHDWDVDCFNTLSSPEFRESKQAAQLFAGRAMIRAKAHDVSGSDEDLAAMWNLSDRIGEEPSLITPLVQIALRAMTRDAAERCAEFYVDPQGPGLSGVIALNATTARMTSQINFAFILRSEAYFSFEGLRNMEPLKKGYEGKSLSIDEILHPKPIDPRIIIRTGEPEGPDAGKYGPAILRMHIALLPIILTDRSDLIKLKDDLTRVGEVQVAKGGPAARMVKDYTETLATFVDEVMRNEAGIRTVRAYVAAALFHARKRWWPKDVSELPGKWIDPYDGDSLRISTRSGTFRVYSVGPSLVVVDGKTLREVPFNGQYNIAAAYPSAN